MNLLDRTCRLSRGAALGIAVALTLAFAAACSSDSKQGTSTATRVSSRHQLIGGLNALGEVGDYRLENGEVQLIVQDKGFNRGNGLFGGSLIDADLVRTNQRGDARGGNGNDTLGEIFPAFFLEVVDPGEIRVVDDGSLGKAAAVEVRGKGGEFVTMLRFLNQAIVNSYEPQDLFELLRNADMNEHAPPSSDGRPLTRFATRYVLEPGARHVRVEATVRNNGFETLEFPNQDVVEILEQPAVLGIDLGDFTVPTGQVLGFGAVNDVFVPGIGYDLRWGLEEAYRRDVSLPAFPGKLADFVATSNPDGISYGYFTKRSPEHNFVCNKDCCQLEGEARNKCIESEGEDVDLPDGTSLSYGGRGDPNDMLLLFDASGFAGVFTHQLPPKLAPDYCQMGKSAEKACNELLGTCEDEECKEQKQACMSGYEECVKSNENLPSKYTYTNYFVIGDGSVSSILDEMYRVRGTKTRTVRGQIFDEQSGNPVGENVELLLYRPRPGAESADEMCTTVGSGRDEREPVIFNQTFTNADGYFEFTIPPGDYCYRTRESGRPLTEYRHLEVGDSDRFLRVTARSRARIEARVTNEAGRPMPAKLSVVGTHEYRGGAVKRSYLYDLRAGQGWRTTDLRPDKKDDPSTRRFIEAVGYASSDGEIRRDLRPGRYILSFSRGPEYERVTREVTLSAGEIEHVNVQLEKVVETPGYVSGDFHMHAQGSIDSGLDYTDRVVSIAAEDVDVVVSSDHNYVSDYLPYIRREDLDQWMKSFVGVELTTFEFGHFNAFPLDYEVGSVNRGSIKWQRVPPQKIFDKLRQKGRLGPEQTIVQVNHPRDSILGYFSQFDVDGFTAESHLEFLEKGDAQQKAITTVSMPTGEAFLRDCRPKSVDCTGECPSGTNCEEPRFETRFSWDFDALEIFNGKRMELNRHYRIPYGKHEWPTRTAKQLLQQTCDADDNCNQPVDLLQSTCCQDGYRSPTSDSCSNTTPSKGKCPIAEKRQEFLAEQYPEDAVLCDGGDVAFPGGLDDWYNTLNYARPYIENEPGATQHDSEVYHRITATGNSDSHHAGKPNLTAPGHPRNYFYTGHDEPEQVSARDLVEAMQNHRNIVTNGPFALMRVKDSDGSKAEIGQQIQVDGDRATIEVSIRAADWVGADRFRLMSNGEPVKSLKQDGSKVEQDEFGWVSIDLGEDGTFESDFSVPLERDSWFVLEVEGDQNLFPVYPPSEIPRLPFDEIIGQIAGSFGFGGGTAGLEPDETFALRPFAFTNPIWVVHDRSKDSDGEFTPPAPEPETCKGGVVAPGGLTGPEAYGPGEVDERLDSVSAPLNLKSRSDAPFAIPSGEPRDVRTLFRQWGHH